MRTGTSDGRAPLGGPAEQARPDHGAAVSAGTTRTIEIVGVSKQFGANTVVDDLHLDIGDGEFFSLLGPSGCGKTTTLRMVAGFERPTSGSILLGGADITRQAPAKRPLNMVFQDYALFPHLTVVENVAFGLKVKRLAREERHERVTSALATMQLAGLAERRPNQLSGGQRQRVALARALVNRPHALLLDEPLGALDLKLRKEMQAELKEVHRATGTTFLYVTHDQEEALTMSDRIAVMRDGRVEQLADPRTLYEKPSTAFVADFIGTSNLLVLDHPTTAGSLLVVALDGGERLTARVQGPVPTAAQVQITVRPERISLHTDLGASIPETHSRVRGRALDVVYCGSTTHVTVEIGTGERLVIHQLSDNPILREVRRGVETLLSWAPDGAHVIGPVHPDTLPHGPRDEE
jgi:spermidine/putrescine transport system ATP-binding protein